MQTRKMISHLTRLLAMSLFIALIVAMPARAESPSTGWLSNPAHPPLNTRVVLTGNADPKTNAVEGFLEVQLDGDWKTYWRSPGEGGIAPSLNWQPSENIKDITWLWPAPNRFNLLGIDTLGYKEKVIFPITFYVDDFDKSVHFRGTFTISSCTTVCVLTDYPVALTFTPSALKTDVDNLHLYAQGMSNVPKESPLLKSISTVWDESSQRLEVVAHKITDWQSPDVLVDGNSDAVTDVLFSVPTIHVDGDTLRATFNVTSWMGEPLLEKENISVTFIDDDFVAEHQSVVTSGILSSSTTLSFTSAILFALLGGLILNIMPCVLPVLGIKLSGVISAQGLEKKQIRRQFVASAAGIIFSFWMIAALLSGLKLTGNAIGWGIQFQSSFFIGFMVVITALFAANMLGLFNFRLSSDANTWLATQGDNSYSGHFVQGMFATLLATPCSAPFLGTAVAFALTTSYFTLFSIFTALALGMALPWLLVAAFPSIAQCLPKPGRWMNVVKIVFGFMMLATTAWLLSLLVNHMSLRWISLLGFLVFALMLWRTAVIYGRKVVIIMAAISLVLTATVMLIASLTATHWATPLPQDHLWEKLSESRITSALNEGNTVFVDVTADWCITCKANKIGVLLQDPVYSQLNEPNITLLQGDWTVPSETVTNFLQKHGRYGVPFNIVYGPGAPQGIPLPVVLSSDMVLKAIDIAKGDTDE